MKRCLIHEKTAVKDGPTWHRDLFQAALDEGIVDAELHGRLATYLSFRHFFIQRHLVARLGVIQFEVLRFIRFHGEMYQKLL